MSQSTGSQVIQCDVCQATFSRQEHLNRHARSHTTEKPFQCPDCGKRFARMDVLHRHGQSHASKAKVTDGAGSRACKECAVSRVRCARGNPCERCEQRDLQCVYPVAKKRKIGPSSPPRVSSLPSVDNLYYSGDDGASLDQREPASDARSRRSQIPMPEAEIHDSGLLSSAPAQASGAEWFPPEASVNRTALPDNILDSASKGGLLLDGQILEKDFTEWVRNMPSVNWLSPQDLDIIFPNSQLDELLLPNPSSTALEVGLNENRAHIGFDRPTYDPTLDDNLGFIPPMPPPAPVSLSTGTDPLPSESGVSTGDSLPSNAASGTYYVEGTFGRAPFQGRSSWRPGRGSFLKINSGAMAGERTPAPGGSSIRSDEVFVSTTVYENLVHQLTAQCESGEFSLDLAQLPSLSEMQHLVQLYFEGFHPMYPFLRKCPSQFASTHCWILVLSVATIGSPYTRTARYHQLGVYMAGLVDHILINRAGGVSADDDDSLWTPGVDNQDLSAVDLVTLQAGILNCLFLLHAGNRTSARRALLQRYGLVETTSQFNLLSSVEPLSSEVLEGLSQLEIANVWVNRESRIRTGWMVWLLDSITQYEFNCLPLMHIGDARAPLPCREDIWARSTESLVDIGGKYNSVTLIDALELLYIEKTLPPNLGELSTNVLIFAICRRTREAIAQHQTDLTFWSPSAKKEPRSVAEKVEESWPPSVSALSKWRNSACDCLDILHWDANSTVARAKGWEHPAILHLHLARVILLAPVRYIQELAVQYNSNTASQEPESTCSMTARYHVLRWAVRDQYKARLSLIHAGALLWHVPRYSSNSFLEPFCVYAATLVIWAYSISAQWARGQALPNTASLDSGTPTHDLATESGHRAVPEPNTVDSDESEGDTESVIIQLDRPCDDEIVQAYVCLGHRISARMSRVGDILDPAAPRRILKQGLRLLTRTRQAMELQSPNDSAARGTTSEPGAEAFPCWGVELSFANSLRALASRPITPQHGFESVCE